MYKLFSSLLTGLQEEYSREIGKFAICLGYTHCYSIITPVDRVQEEGNRWVLEWSPENLLLMIGQLNPRLSFRIAATVDLFKEGIDPVRIEGVVTTGYRVSTCGIQASRDH